MNSENTADVLNLSNTSEVSLPGETPAVEYFETKINNGTEPENNLFSPADKEVDLKLADAEDNNKDEVVLQPHQPREYGLENKKDSEIYVKATKKVWIKLKKDGFYKYDAEKGDVGTGTTLFETILEPGDIYYVPDEDDLYLTIGNAQGIEIYADGDLIEPISPKEVSRHNIEMNVKKLKKGTAYIKNRVID